MAEGWGWAGRVADFLRLSENRLLADLTAHHSALMAMPPSESQLQAWTAEHATLTEALAAMARDRPAAAEWALAFEYELPLEGGRRPDVILLAGGTIIVIEFKSEWGPTTAQLDQAVGYARDISATHSLLSALKKLRNKVRRVGMMSATVTKTRARTRTLRSRLLRDGHLK